MNNLKFYTALSLIFFTSVCFSQNQNNIWYFGERAGLNFNTNPPTALNDGVFSHAEGVSSVCDASGALLFFTNGIQVWNSNLQQMPNGFGLAGNNSSSQIIIVPNPTDCDIYYIFTTPIQNINGPLSYSIVNMKLEGGYGDITNKNTFLINNVTERITATLKRNGTDYWVVAQGLRNHSFLSFSVTSSGVDGIPIVSGNLDETLIYTPADAIGCMKFSRDGSKLCYASEIGIHKSYLYDFDNLTGLATNGFIISDTAAYGVEFSENNSKLYLARYDGFKLTQYDLSSGNSITIKNSGFIIASNQVGNTITRGGALQVGTNNEIYIAKSENLFLSVIKNPNLLGNSCAYMEDAIDLNGRNCYAGLPNFIKKHNFNPNCGGLRATFSHTTLCGENDVKITITATFGSSPYQYSLDNTIFQNSNIFSNLATGSYEITVKDVNNNKRTVSLIIPSNNGLSLQKKSVKLPNCGFSDGEISLSASNGLSPYTYSKDGINFQSNANFSSLAESMLNFTVKDANGCTANFLISLPSVNNLKVFAGLDTGIFVNQTVQLFAKDLTNSNFIHFKWLPIDGLDNPLSPNPIATITKNIDYTVEAINALGCSAKDTIHIDVYKEIGIFVPTAFTPNADNRNDILKAIPRGMNKLNYFRIYNRYGQQIFYSNSFYIGWDGKLNGVAQNSNSYLWFAEGVDIKGNIVRRQGMFSLIR
jgi:gliding motility-associated-like protein